MQNQKDGFEHFDSHISTSQPFQHLHLQQQAPKDKQFNYLVVQKMDVEGPNLMDRYILQPLSSAGQSALKTTKNAITQIPSLLSWGAIGIFHKIQSAFQREEQPKQEEQQPIQQEEEIEDLPVLLVVPQEILDAPLKDRLEWIEKHKENCELFIPKEKPIHLNQINQLKNSSSSSSDTPDDCDFQLRRISQEFKSTQTVSDLFPSTQSIQASVTQRKQFLISQEDFQKISQQNLDVETQKNPQNILLYPLLGEIIPRQQILDQIKNYQLEQSSVTVIQKNVEPIQTQEILEDKFMPLKINGLPFEKQEAQPIVQQQPQQQEERQLEALLEY